MTSFGLELAEEMKRNFFSRNFAVQQLVEKCEKMNEFC